MIEAANTGSRPSATLVKAPPATPASAWPWSRNQKGYKLILVVPDR